MNNNLFKILTISALLLGSSASAEIWSAFTTTIDEVGRAAGPLATTVGQAGEAALE
ncbi:MAG: hypothetical protein P8L77_03960 [Gammaproteobacteria bacterium]|nr:hypothetical protein [Gammaproteobacteria bacterium]